MYEWRQLRLLAAVLLLLPVFHIAYLVSDDLRSYLNPSPQVWAEDMAAYIDTDERMPLPQDPVLVVGGHRVRLWGDLQGVLAPRPVLLRPLGDARIEDLTYHYLRLIAHYRPRLLVVFPGYADLHLRDNKTPEELVSSLAELLRLDAEYRPLGWRFIVAPVHMPLHPGDRERIAAMGQGLKELARRSDRLKIIDPNPVLSGDAGRPNPRYYLGDGINLSAEGYARISDLLGREIALHESIGEAERQVH
jgi:hypothetical protein